MITEGQASEWAALLCGSPGTGPAQLQSWWTNRIEGLSCKIQEFPEEFQTTRFAGRLKFCETHMSALAPLFRRLGDRALAFSEAMAEIRHHFSGERLHLLKWRETLEGLGGLKAWLPAYGHARQYLDFALPLGEPDIDQLRPSLRAHLKEPTRFLQAQSRSEFEGRFLAFKKAYMERYAALHDSARRIPGRTKIDQVALRNLDLLSTLEHTEKTHLNRVKLLAHWVERHECRLPVRQILELHPRCYCGFNPSSSEQPANAAGQINALVQEGIEYYRKALRRFGKPILQELRAQPDDDEVAIQIRSALARGPMIALKPASVRVMNRVILKHPELA